MGFFQPEGVVKEGAFWGILMGDNIEKEPFMNIQPIAAFSDNYIWALDLGEGDLVLVDPGQAKPALDFLRGKNLKAILLTHEHPDHTGGLEDLVRSFPQALLFGPEEIAFDGVRTLGHGEVFSLGDYRFQVLGTQGHTRGHISYLVEDRLFCGDALFVGGCGRNFTGDLELQYRGLERIKSLPDQTLIYPAHEYTLANLAFAQDLLGSFPALSQALERARGLLDQGLPSIPTSLGQEKTYNPFLLAKSLEEFKDYRRRKDEY